MARLFEVKDLDERKRALVAESEAYRDSLRLQVQNLKLRGTDAGRKLRRWALFSPLALLVIPLVGRLVQRRKSKKTSLLSTAFSAWQLYRRFGLPLKTVLAILTYMRKRRI